MDMRTDEARDPRMDPALDELRRAMAAVDTPRAVEKELMQAFARQHRKASWYQRIAPARWAMAGGLASVMAVAIGVLVALQPGQQPGAGAQLINRDGGDFFIAIESLESIEQEPNPRMIEADLPRTELASLGVPVTPENAGESVRAEMLVSADGRPLAFRLSSIQ
ncbi:hypothetical protein D3872_20140 [Massilia cavernae]|uniref:Uncharacterized protein n=2 Tax=Massilia cavernae TaxID=2320864 RepID=A0A418XFU6_9BURK|nr:hypothetical protein D3872_20140 [Massilia cavernae]